MMHILAVDGTPIDPIWAAEFRGLFWGEGHFSITRAKRIWSRRKRGGKSEPIPGPFYRLNIMIELRIDDTPLLEEIQRVLGGGLYFHKHSPKRPNEAPRRRWQTRNKSEHIRACQVLEGTLLPAKKAKELTIFAQAANLLGPKGKKLTPEIKEEFEYLHQELRRVRQYSEC